jgi:hypothetical protein
MQRAGRSRTTGWRGRLRRPILAGYGHLGRPRQCVAEAAAFGCAQGLGRPATASITEAKPAPTVLDLPMPMPTNTAVMGSDLKKEKDSLLGSESPV